MSALFTSGFVLVVIRINFSASSFVAAFYQHCFDWAFLLRSFTGVFPFILSLGLIPVHSFAWTISMDSLAGLSSLPFFAAQIFMGLSPGCFFCDLVFGGCFGALFRVGYLHAPFCKTVFVHSTTNNFLRGFYQRGFFDARASMVSF